jgi:hypothetical protein
VTAATKTMLKLSEHLLLTARPMPAPTVASVERELQRLPHLTADRSHPARRTRRSFRDARALQTAQEAIGSLPGPDEATHLIVSGRFALWRLVPAALALADCSIDELLIGTLGFSRANIDGLCALLDSGRVKTLHLLASHYFKGTSGPTYQHAADLLASRPKARFVSLRTHAKLLLMKFSDGRRLTVESSANLRSCQNIEQMTLIGDPAVFEFHREWMLDLFTAAPGAA